MKILVAEDSPAILEGLRSILEKEGFVVVAAMDGEQALQMWKEERPDMVCLDIMMPKLDGYGVCRAIRAVDTTIPVIFLSAKSEETDVVIGLELGANDFVRKPFGRHELLARLRAALRSRRNFEKAATRFDFGDWQVFPDELRARRDGANIDLSPRELSILDYFYRFQGKVVTRDALLNACWGLDYFPESRSLDQQIARLRKKIERDVANPTLIITVRGAGYRYPRM